MTERPFMTILEFADWAGLSRSRVYVMLGTGELRGVKIGRSAKIRRDEAERWLNSLPNMKLRSGS